jgi:peptidoglycan/LPS O-acetylase OafA/YrhL
MRYRPEIDGLRAVAVIPVLFYHAGFPIFSGGFVGVDVFFVISGYLITTILNDEIEMGHFNIWRFYERRARRILPALFFVMFACLPFAWHWMLPEQFMNFGQSLIAVGFFASNILFWKESGYFEASAEEKPLLHTWSLAVEEQYYLLFPLFLFFAFRYGKKRVFWMIVVMATVSLCLAELGWRHKPVANFYLAPTRAWELLAGSLVAFLISDRDIKANGFYAAVGCFVILYAIHTFDAHTPFPSIFTLIPVVGAVLIILYGSAGTRVAQVLSVKPVVGIGLISYSIYLWHQPLFAFARIRLIHEPSLLVMILLTLVSLFLGYCTWRYVEQPFRNGSGLISSRAKVFMISGSSITIFAAMGSWIHVTKGADFRMPDNVNEIMSARIGDSSNCHNGFDHIETAAGKSCVIGAVGMPASIAILGDSHVARITDAFSDALKLQGQAALTFNGSWCAPLMHFATNAAKKNACVQMMNASIFQALERDQIETVILFAEWSNYTSGSRSSMDGAATYVFDASGGFSFEGIKPADNVAHFEKAVKYTFDILKRYGKHVIVVMPTPEFDFHVPKTLAKLKLFNESVLQLPTVVKAGYNERNGDALLILREQAAMNDFTVLEPFSIFCTTGDCVFSSSSGNALYEDDNHLNYDGARLLVAPLLKEVFPSENKFGVN